MTYEVPGMKLIPQQKTMSCWYASARMLINWRMEASQMSFANLIPPELDEQCKKIRDGNAGITNPQIITMAKRLGLVAVPPMSPTPAAIENWLVDYGPLWVNGKSHIVVIAGIKPSGGSHSLKVYDPLPVNVGKIDWRDIGSWYAMGSSISTRDTGATVQTVFLHCPKV